MTKDYEIKERKVLGRLAFEVYRAERGGKNHDGTETPGWVDLGEEIRHAWSAAAVAVVVHSLKLRSM